jgi:hypothetical protein
MDTVSFFNAAKSFKARVHYFVIVTIGVPGFDKHSSPLVRVIGVDRKTHFSGRMNQTLIFG